MAEWLDAGRRIKAEWEGMLRAASSADDAPAKVPFVPLRMTGRALNLALREILPILLGPNASLLTVVAEDGKPIKAYAEDASSGVYERLVRLDAEGAAGLGDLMRKAEAAGVDIGVVKQAEIRFFARFENEPEDMARALALLAGAGAEALREGDLRFEPAILMAEIAALFRLDPEDAHWLLAGLLPDGVYGVALGTSAETVALRLTVAAGRWSAEETRVESREIQTACEELVGSGCGIAFGASVPAARESGLAEFIRGRGRHWAVATRSTLEGLLGAWPAIAELLDIEKDLEECNISFDSLFELALEYLANARDYACREGIVIGLSLGEEKRSFLLDENGISRTEREADFSFDLRYLHRALGLLCDDAASRARDLVPAEVMDEIGYSTALADVALERGGRLLLFGGPHQFFNRSWDGDACAIHLDANGRARVVEAPAIPLRVELGGKRVSFEGSGLSANLEFAGARARHDPYGAGSLLGELGSERESRLPGPARKLAEWLPGLEVSRQLFRLASADIVIDGVAAAASGGWMYLEEGLGSMLRWPMGSTWHYASWLYTDGECGSGVTAVPMTGRSTPRWWERLVSRAVDGAVWMNPEGGDAGAFLPAIDSRPPARAVRKMAQAAHRELCYQVLSAVAAPFDEDGTTIFRLRCLCAGGAGLVEIPASLPETETGPARTCDLDWSEKGLSIRSEGRELLFIETGGEGGFLSPYVPPRPGLLRRLADYWR